MRLPLTLKLQFLIFILAVIGIEHSAFAQPNFDGRLIGEWVGVTAEFSGDKTIISQNSIVLNGQAIPLKFISSGVFIIGAPGEEEEMQYTLSGDTLTVRSSDETSVWKRTSQQTVQANPLERKGSEDSLPGISSKTESDPFARNFKGDGIALNLNGTTNAGFTGELSFAGQTFPVSARAQGNSLSGSFRTADGGAFEFYASLRGDFLDLQTGNSRYSLKAEPNTVSRNPLDSIAPSSNTQHPSPLSNPSKSTQRPSSGIIFKEHKITDPGMNNIVASTVLVPEDWKVEGGLNRPSPQLYSIPVLVDIKFTAPDGRQAHFFPSLVFDFDLNQPGQVLQPTLKGNLNMPLPQSPGAWIMEMSRINPDPEISQLRLVSEEDLPEQTKVLREQNQFLYQQLEQTNQMGRQTGLMSLFDTQATKVVITYDQGGRSYEESFLVMWNYIVSSWQGQVTSGLWSIASMLSLRGAVGEDYLNDPELIAILSSVRINPAWQAEMDKYWAQLAQIRHKGNMDRLNASAAAHQKRMNTLNETSDIIMSGWKSRNESQDRMHAQTIDTIHEQTPYVTPTGETVKLPSFYDNVYTDGNGRFILNNDSLYEPNTDPLVNSQNWQRIEATR